MANYTKDGKSTSFELSASDAAALQEFATKFRRILNSTLHEATADLPPMREGMTRVNVKTSHVDDEDLNAWNLEGGNIFEFTTPTNMAEHETVFVTRFLQRPDLLALIKERKNGGIGYGTHMHVDAACLQADEKRLVGLMLMWENFYDSLNFLTHSHRWSQKNFAAKIEAKSPDLLSMLQQRWLNKTYAEQDTLMEAFAKFESSLDRTFSTENGDPERDGYRRLAVNMCHVLDVNCCVDCDKNNVRKFGALEFRQFDASLGKDVLLFALIERMVQAACSASYEEMEPLLALPNNDRSDKESWALGAYPLMQFLKLDWNTYKQANIGLGSASALFVAP